MITRTGSTLGAALGVLLLSAAHTGAEEPPPPSSSSQSRHHTHHHHSHHADKNKSQPTPAAAQPAAAEPAPAAEPTPAAGEATLPGAAVATPAPPAAQPRPKAPSRGVVTQAQSDLQQSQLVDRPWVKGVPPAEQAAALDLFREGNGLLKESLFVQAAAKYREAQRHWDHPGIHYNLALALLNLDQPVEVYKQLQEALKYGLLPLDKDKFDHATNYLALIEKQVARVGVECQLAGTVVSFDGQRVFTAPGRYDALVRAGQHTIVGEKPGYVTAQKTPTLPAGQKTTIELKMYTADDLTRYRRRFPNWVPYTVLGAGLLVGGVGGVLYWRAHESFSSYDSGVAQCSKMNMDMGCTQLGGLTSKHSTGQTLQVSAFSLWGVGGALLLSGVTLVSLNRARPYRISVESDKVSLSPVVGPGLAGLVASVQFGGM